MREIMKKILEVTGNEDVILIGREDQSEIKTIGPEEIELHQRKYRNIIVEDMEQLDEKTMKKLVEITDCLWVIFSIDKMIKKVDSTIENMVEKQEFKSIAIDEKIENLKKLSGGNALIANFHLPDMAVVIPKLKEKFLADLKTDPLSSFFLNLSMVEYLKSKLEETKKEKEKMGVELEMEKFKNKTESEKINIFRDETKRMKMEKDEIDRKMLKQREEFEARIRKETIKFCKEREWLEDELEKVKKMMDEKIMEREEQIEEKYKEELKNIILKMGLKLEEKEKELKRLKNAEENDLK